MVRLFKKGNSKLSKDVLTFNLPAGQEVCGRECVGCYALREQKRWKNVRTSRDNMLNRSQQDTFIDEAISELKKFGKKYVRVHASGEFYSQEYVDKWLEIAKALPNLTFYAYTKRESEFDFSGLHALPNFVLHNSYVHVNGGQVVNYGKPAYLEQIVNEHPQAFICPLSKDRDGLCGKECTWCMEKENEGTPILFEIH